MKELKRFEIIIEAVKERIKEEVGTLIGAELELVLQPAGITTKEDFFDQPIGRQVVAKMDITGDVEGKGALLLSVKDAIRLGGTLIMLPPAELEEVIANESYDGETEDSYGEIANIIAGSFTKVFEEMYPRSCRFIRKEQELISPLKVDPDSDEPIPPQQYFQIIYSMSLDSKQLGDMITLVPAVPFGLAEEKTADDAVEVEEHKAQVEPPAADQPEKPAASVDADPGESEIEEQAQSAETEHAAQKQEPSSGPEIKDLEKHKKRVDSLLKTCQEKIEEEVGVLLGVEVACSIPENKFIKKEDYFYEEAQGKQIVATMEVAGDLKDTSYLYVGLKDAIRIGGTLIMLPPNELETAIGEEDFTADCEDAYGEIANIIAGVYTAVFEEQYIKAIRFIKRDIEKVVPMKVDISSDEPMPDQRYYMSTMNLSLDGTTYGNMQVLFPASLLQLDAYGQATAEQADETADSAQPGSPDARPETGAVPDGAQQGVAVSGEAGSEDVLIISDSEPDSHLIQKVCASKNITCRQVSFRDPFRNYLPGNFKAVFLVMNKVDEQSFGVAIKVSSCCSLPLIAAGAEWTRSRVIQAVKYGVTDILLTPADEDDVVEKIENNIMDMAA